MLDGGRGAAPPRGVDAWLLTDLRAELIAEIRSLAKYAGTHAAVAGQVTSRGTDTLRVEPREVVREWGVEGHVYQLRG